MSATRETGVGALRTPQCGSSSSCFREYIGDRSKSPKGRSPEGDPSPSGDCRATRSTRWSQHTAPRLLDDSALPAAYRPCYVGCCSRMRIWALPAVGKGRDMKPERSLGQEKGIKFGPDACHVQSRRTEAQPEVHFVRLSPASRVGRRNLPPVRDVSLDPRGWPRGWKGPPPSPPLRGTGARLPRMIGSLGEGVK
jgi:hypothetical protein